MILPLIDVPFSTVHLYQKPISMRFGEKKLLDICRSALKREPRANELFLFYNGKRDTLKLFWLDGTGSQELFRSRYLVAASCCLLPRMERFLCSWSAPS